MTSSNGKRGRIGALLVAALGVLALLALPGIAAAKDRNHDHIPDRWEKRHHLSLKVNQARRDQDGDHLRNRAEFLAGDNPRNADTDNDGVKDGEEQAGTVASFDGESGRLTINLFGGDTISGLVTEGTEIKCDGESSQIATLMEDQSGDGSSGSADNSGSGEESGEDSGNEEEAGDDGGDHGEEAGDDSGGNEEESGDHSGGNEEESAEGHGDHGEESGDDNEGGSQTCTTADLVPGAVVQEAQLQLTNGQAIFEEVELSGHSVG